MVPLPVDPGAEGVNEAVAIVVVVVVEEDPSRSQSVSVLGWATSASPGSRDFDVSITETPIVIFLRLPSVRIPPA